MKASFQAYISSKRSAIGIDGIGGGSVTLEFSDSHVAEALKLVAMRNCIVKVDIEVVSKTQQKPAKSKKKVNKESNDLDDLVNL